MADVENHTIRLLQEMREDMRTGFAGMKTEFTRLESKMNDGFEHLAEEIDDLRKAFAGESVIARFVVKGVDDRLQDLERRMSALEKAQP